MPAYPALGLCGETIDLLCEEIARAYVSPFSYERAAARADLSHQVTLDLISGTEPRVVVGRLQALLAKLHEPARLRTPGRPRSPVTPATPAERPNP
jgi:hypothetical protein